MHTTIRFEWLATATDDLQDPLYTRKLMLTNARRRRRLEHCWGLRHGEFDENSSLNTLTLRPSITRIFSRCALVPTEDTLTAMLQMQQYNLACPVDQRKRYDEEFPAREHQYMFVPIDELPPLVIASPGCKPTPFTVRPGQFPIFTSTTNPWYLCEHASRGVVGCDPVDELPWVETLITLIDAWSWYGRPVASFLSTPRSYPHRHVDSLPGSEDEPEDDDSSSDISTPDEDGNDYKGFQAWAAKCANVSNCVDMSFPMDEDIDNTEFIYTLQRPPAWCSDSKRGNQWLHYLLAAAAS